MISIKAIFHWDENLIVTVTVNITIVTATAAFTVIAIKNATVITTTITITTDRSNTCLELSANRWIDRHGTANWQFIAHNL